MHDSELVSTRERLADLADDIAYERHRQGPGSLDAAHQILTVEELHHDVGEVVVGDAVIEDLDDVRTFDFGGGRRFPFETRERFLILGVLDRQEIYRNMGIP